MTGKAIRVDWLLLALSLANLVFLRSWIELLRFQAGQEAGAEQARTMLAATLASILLLAGTIYGGRWLAEWRGGATAVTAARCGFLLLCVTPLDFLDGQVRPLTNGWLPQGVYLAFWTALLMAPVIAAVRLSVFGKPDCYRALRGLVLVLSPLLALLTANLAWSAYGPSSMRPATELAGPIGRPAGGRVVWIIFDELDYRLAFEARPPSIEMPELDRLRQTAFFASRTLPPAWETPEAMAGYLLGQAVAKLDAQPPNLHAVLKDGSKVDLKSSPTVLSEARRLGVDTYLAGWYLPYCQMFSRQLTGCLQPSPASIRTSDFRESFVEQWSAQYHEHWFLVRFSSEARLRAPWFGWGERTDQYRGYRQLLAESLRMAAGDGGRYVIVHFPIPHPLGIWDRRRNELSLNTANNSLDNLELVDWTVGQIRRAMENAGHWEDAAVIVTSDHPMRPDVWAVSEVWSEEERRATGNRRHERIPCLIKPPAGSRGFESDKTLPALSLSSLSLAMLSGQVRSVEDVARYLDSPGLARSPLGALFPSRAEVRPPAGKAIVEK